MSNKQTRAYLKYSLYLIATFVIVMVVRLNTIQDTCANMCQEFLADEEVLSDQVVEIRNGQDALLYRRFIVKADWTSLMPKLELDAHEANMFVRGIQVDPSVSTVYLFRTQSRSCTLTAVQGLVSVDQGKIVRKDVSRIVTIFVRVSP
jgi:hypothetical protein